MVGRTAGAIILRMSHGYQVKESHDPIVECVDQATEQFSLATAPGAFLVDVMPWSESTCIYCLYMRSDALLSAPHPGVDTRRHLPGQSGRVARDVDEDGRRAARLCQAPDGLFISTFALCTSIHPRFVETRHRHAQLHREPPRGQGDQRGRRRHREMGRCFTLLWRRRYRTPFL